MSGISGHNTLSFADLQVLGSGERRQADSLREAVTQFESLFVNMMLKSMRDANAVLSEGSYLHSSEIQMHQQMLDQQMAVHLSEQGGIGLADPLMQQLSGGLMSGPDNQALAARPQSQGVMVVPNATERAVAPAPAPEPAAGLVGQSDPQRFETPLEFVQQLLPTFQRGLANTAISPITALAQAALETGWGKSGMQTAEGQPARNLFGIKAHNWSGDFAAHNTLEFSGDTPIPKRALFRAYDSWDASVSDYANLLSTSPRYAQAIAHAQEPERFLRELQASGYATDPNYANKILAVLAKVENLLR